MTRLSSILAAVMLAWQTPLWAQSPEPINVEGQPLAGNVRRLLTTLEFLGSPLPADAVKAINTAADNQDARKLQELSREPAAKLVVRTLESLAS